MKQNTGSSVFQSADVKDFKLDPVMKTARIAIIGGGPGGLMTARQLRTLTGDRCIITIFEASPRLGGKIRTETFKTASVRYEAGAAELYDYSAIGVDPLSDLIREAGLERRPLTGKTVVMNDRLLTTDQDIQDSLGADALKALRDFQHKAKSLISPAEYYESDWRADNDDPLSRKTFAELLKSVPNESTRKYIVTSIHSDLATESHHTSAMYGLQNYLMNEPGYMSLYAIDGGIEQLIHALTRNITAEIKLRHRVVKIEKTTDQTYRVFSRQDHLLNTDASSQEFDFVVIALPNNLIHSIEYQEEKLATALHRHYIHYDYPAHYLRVSILFEKPFWRDQVEGSYFMTDAFGGCCVYDESSRIEDCTYGVLGWLIAGDAALSMGNFEDQSLIDRVIGSLPGCLSHGRSMQLEGHVHRWAGAVNGWPGGYPAKDPDARHLPEPEDNPHFFVVGDYLFDSTLNGVMDSADTVAQWIDELTQE